MTHQNTAYWLAFHFSRGVGYRRLMRWVSTYGDITALHALSQSQREQEKIPPLVSINDAAVLGALKWAEQDNHHIITCDSPWYPSLLLSIDHPPLLLYVIGDPSTLAQAQIGMVGTRMPSPQGRENAAYFAQGLAQAGLQITSGMALGVDAQSHQACLDVGQKTIAVLGTGVDVCYPRRHRRLAQAIATQGALVSEFPLGTTPERYNFPKRNRLISGLSLGVLVIEAAERSGSLITARYAAEQGREVFALPGSIHNRQARGCHVLLREGACLVESVEDITNELTNWCNFEYSVKDSGELTKSLDDKQQKLVKCIGDEVTSIETLQMRSEMSIEAVIGQLSTLELLGVVQAVPGGYMRI